MVHVHLRIRWVNIDLISRYLISYAPFTSKHPLPLFTSQVLTQEIFPHLREYHQKYGNQHAVYTMLVLSLKSRIKVIALSF